MRRPLSVSFQLTLVVSALWVGACDNFGEIPCTPACEDGLVCDTETGQCHPPRLAAHEGTTPGRGVRLAAADDEVYLTAVDPDDDQVLVGLADGDDPTLYELAETVDADTHSVALSGSDSAVAVAWRDARDRYRIGLHRPEDDIRQWRPTAPIGPADETYRASSHFDVATGEDDALHLVFYDSRERGLYYMSGTFGEDDWQLEEVDVPSAGDDEGDDHCPLERRDEVGRGVGLQPDLVRAGGGLFVSYRDGDCGDLRLARRVDDAWVVSVVDTGEGDDEQTASRGDVGQFSSLAFDDAGNLAIAYYDGARGQLSLAYEVDGQFDLEVVDPGYQFDESARRRKHMVGGFAELAFDEENRPLVVYMDGTRARLRLAQRRQPLDTDGEWAGRLLSPPPPAGFSAAVARAPSSGLVIATERFSVGGGRPLGQLELVLEDDL